MLIILDRDGVINYDSKDYIKSPDEWTPIPGSLEAIARLNKAGHLVVVATNQSGVGRRYFSLETLEAIHQKMQQALSEMGGHLDTIYFCPHHPNEECKCRKPKPGMLIQAGKDLKQDITKAIFIGDSLRDIQAARKVKCTAAFIGDVKMISSDVLDELHDVAVFKDLSSVVDDILDGHG